MQQANVGASTDSAPNLFRRVQMTIRVIDSLPGSRFSIEEYGLVAASICSGEG
jgi:hypothetical protein